MRRSLPRPSVCTEHTPIDLTHAPLDFPLSGARLHSNAGPRLLTPHAAAAHGRTPNQHRSRSIHRERGGRANRFHHSSRRAVHWLGPVPIHNHFITRTGRSCGSTDEANAAPLCSCAPRRTNRPVTATTLNLFTWLSITSLSRTLVSRIARALLRILKRVQSR